MADAIVYVDRSDVRPGRLAELKEAIRELAEFVASHEPRLLAYQVHFTPDGAGMSVLHVHANAESLAFHLEVAAERFRRFAGLLELRAIDVYGDPGAELVERLRAKAVMLGGRVTVHDLHAGFARFPGGPASRAGR